MYLPSRSVTTRSFLPSSAIECMGKAGGLPRDFLHDAGVSLAERLEW
jgi:hypothetical protein